MTTGKWQILGLTGYSGEATREIRGWLGNATCFQDRYYTSLQKLKMCCLHLVQNTLKCVDFNRKLQKCSDGNTPGSIFNPTLCNPHFASGCFRQREVVHNIQIVISRYPLAKLNIVVRP